MGLPRSKRLPSRMLQPRLPWRPLLPCQTEKTCFWRCMARPWPSLKQKVRHPVVFSLC